MSRKKSVKKKSAKSLYAQKEVHELLYSDDWHEADTYHQQFQAIIEKAKLRPDKIKAEAGIEGVKRFCKKIEEMAKGRKKIDKTSIFFNIMIELERKDLSITLLTQAIKAQGNTSKIKRIVEALEYCGYLSRQEQIIKLTPKGRKILKRLK